ncbi:MAG: tyrosine-type recombinase/integrase [Chryseolinea sp.]
MAAISLYHDTRSTLKNQKHPVKIRVTWRVVRNNTVGYVVKYFPTHQSLSIEEFEPVSKGVSKGKLREVQEEIFAVRAHIKSLLDKHTHVTPEGFQDIVHGVRRTTTAISSVFNDAVQEKYDAGRIGTSNAYKRALSFFLKHAERDIHLEEITPDWLRKVEYDALADGKHLNTLASYFSSLRTMFKRTMIKQPDLVDPFVGEGHFQIRTQTLAKKRAMPVLVTGALKTLTVTRKNQRAALDFLLFSYYAHGMNFRDMAYLQAENIQSGVLTFARVKTKYTARVQKEISVHINEHMQEILDRRAKSSPYLFGVINDRMNPEQQFNAICNWIKLTNDTLRTIAKKIGYTDKLTTYYARHTFASALINNGVPITKVMDALGHHYVTTTQIYAESLDLETAVTFHKFL